jgi:hypothetical protein
MAASTRAKPVNNAKIATPKRVESNATPKRAGPTIKIEGKKRPRSAQDDDESEIEDASPIKHQVIP